MIEKSIKTRVLGFTRLVPPVLARASWLGTGAVVSNNIVICGGCTVGAGAVVIKDIDTAGAYVDVPARRIYRP